MSWLRTYQPTQGYTAIASPERQETRRIHFGLLRLGEGEEYSGHTQGTEAALVILTGTCTIEGDGFSFTDIGSRISVFDGPPYTILLPSQTAYRVVANDWVEIAICAAPSKLSGETILIAPEDVECRTLGTSSWQRDARFIVDSRVTAESLYLGETIIPPGHWAFPPHCHDVDNLPNEVDMEELYFYRTRPSDGFGVQLLYSDDDSLRESYIVRENDTVIIPGGYHPASASPGDSLYFLWVMAGKKRLFLSRVDPRYARVK